jgi:hypothetical protein
MSIHVSPKYLCTALDNYISLHVAYFSLHKRVWVGWLVAIPTAGRRRNSETYLQYFGHKSSSNRAQRSRGTTPPMHWIQGGMDGHVIEECRLLGCYVALLL